MTVKGNLAYWTALFSFAFVFFYFNAELPLVVAAAVLVYVASSTLAIPSAHRVVLLAGAWLSFLSILQVAILALSLLYPLLPGLAFKVLTLASHVNAYMVIGPIIAVAVVSYFLDLRGGTLKVKARLLRPRLHPSKAVTSILGVTLALLLATVKTVTLELTLTYAVGGAASSIYMYLKGSRWSPLLSALSWIPFTLLATHGPRSPVESKNFNS